VFLVKPDAIKLLTDLVPNEWIPKGIDRISGFGPEYTKRVGCMIPPRTSEVRLFLPPIATDLWFVRSWQGDLKRPRGEASIDVKANESTSATVELPK
jgi:hypothetical protein